VLVETFEPGLVLKLMEEYRAAAMLGVPTMLIAMIEHPSFERARPVERQAICSGGSTVPADLVRRLEKRPRRALHHRLRPDRVLSRGRMTRPDDSIEDKANTLGRPMPNVEVKIVDPDTGETLPVGELGEFCTRGYHVMHEYFENPRPRRKPSTRRLAAHRATSPPWTSAATPRSRVASRT
jgi:fatty-acyl-CoA synthase